MKKYEASKNKTKYNDEQKEKIEDIFLVIKNLMHFYQEYMCYNFYQSIENAEIFLEKVNDDSEFGEHNKYFYLRTIKLIENLKQIKDFSNILSINIIYSLDPLDLSIFEKRNFPYLEQLILTNLRIKDISALLSCQFPVLKKLNLENNLIDNKVIEILKKISLPEITYISLYVNNITSLEIFDVIKRFSKLTSFHIGENKFDFKTDKKAFYEFPEDLEELGLTGNFDGKNIEFIEKLKLGISKLKTFYFSRNKLTNLKSLKNIKFERLYKFWAISNEITDIKEIMNIHERNDLKIINLKDNKLNNFNELFEIINYFPKLELLNVSKNNIQKEEVEEMKKRIKEKYNRDLDIKFEEKD